MNNIRIPLEYNLNIKTIITGYKKQIIETQQSDHSICDTGKGTKHFQI